MLELDGENVVSASTTIGYLHTGIEKTAEQKKWQQVIPLVERMDYLSAQSNSLAFVTSVEKLLGLDLPDRVKWIRVLLAEPQRNQYQGENVVQLEDLTVVYYSKDGRLFTLTGNQGKVHQDSKDMDLVGNVVLVSNDGYRLKTRSMSYQHLSKQIRTPDPVEFEGEQISMTGKGMPIDMEAKTFKVLSQVNTLWKGGRRG